MRRALLVTLVLVGIASAGRAYANNPPTCSGASGLFEVQLGTTISLAFTGDDPDGDSLVAVVAGAPPNAIFNLLGETPPVLGVLTWTPQPEQVGVTYDVDLLFQDTGGLTALCEFSLKATSGVVDSDGDGVNDDVDNCPLAANPDQADLDADGIGDACDPDDDGDGVNDGADNCPTTPNPGQTDNDGDGQGDLCDPDDDNDGVSDGADNCPFAANPGQADGDGDGQGDACDGDDDGDGVPDGVDNCTGVPNADQLDTDGDGDGNACDADDDDDGVPDGADACPLQATPTAMDADLNGCPDLVTDLEALVQSLGLSHGARLRLASKASAAARASRPEQAAHMLQIFIDDVERMRGDELTNAQADLLVAFAQNAIANL